MYERLKEYGVIINSGKCQFGVNSLNFLGHQVIAQGIQPPPEKLEAIQHFPQPNTQRKLIDSLE